MLARRLATEPITDVQGIDGIPFHHIGIHRAVGLIGDPHPFPTQLISGKAVLDNHCVYSIPTEELNVH